MNKKIATEKIEKAIIKQNMLELFYKQNDDRTGYFVIIPVCIKEHKEKQYLIALSRQERAFAFEIKRILSMKECQIKFSLDKDFNIEMLIDKIFSTGKHIKGGYIACIESEDLNSERLRADLKKVETDIKTIIGSKRDDDDCYIDLPDNLDCEKLEELLRSRRYCLDMLFRKDPEGVKHFRKINEFLKSLTDRMYKRSAKIYRQYLSIGMDEEFDDDFMIDADMRFYYGGKESIAILGDEEYYGADFDYMLNVISELCYKFPTCGASFTKSLWKTDKLEMSDRELDLDNSDDDKDWGELKIWIPELEGIKICHAVHEICVYGDKYSVVDLLRMNSFQCEVKTVYQHILDQNGGRYSFYKK